MDKETLSNYGWIVICVLVLAVMLALSSPFGTFVAAGVKSTTQGLFDTNQKALNTTGLVSVESQDFNGSIFRNATIPAGGTYTVKATNTTLSAGKKFPDAPATGDIYVEGDYEYRYNYYYNGSNWTTSATQNSWGVRAKDKTKSSYGEIISEIAGKPLTNMTRTFDNCKSLTTAPKIPSNVTKMYGTFGGCTSLTTAPEIPNSVTDMYSTFSGCTSLTTAPKIPSSVTEMQYTFKNCTSLTTAPDMSNANSVTNVYETFWNCKSLTTAPDMSNANNITTMQSTFQNCTSLTTAPAIPNSVTSMPYTFSGCTALETAPTIPNSVISMQGTFSGCTSLKGTITINANPKGCYDCFYLSSTGEDITLTGTSTKLQNLANTSPKGTRTVYDINGNILRQ